MKKILVGLMVVAMGLMLMSPVVSAYPVSAGDQIKINWGIGNGNNGGSFNISKSATPANILFDTFCLERNEYFSPGGNYYIGSITDSAINGGVGGGNPDKLSSQAAYLFSKWSSWTYAHTPANATALQLAIWKFEDEIAGPGVVDLTNVLANNAIAQAYILDANQNANQGLYGVSVLNIYSCYPGATTCSNPIKQQDMLVGVPEPASMLLFGLGLLGLAGLRRKLKK